MKITNSSGKSTEIIQRDSAEEARRVIENLPHLEYRRITPAHPSSTSPQPYVAINFDAEGKAVGGRTISEFEREQIIRKSHQEGWKIEE